MTSHILLVHGACHTGECWELLEPQLARRGFEVHTLTLSGHRGNPKAPLLVSIKTYGGDVLARADQIGEPCILLGHSMGGFVISEAAERRPDLFSSLIYLTAFVPRFGGRSVITRMAPTTDALNRAGRPRLDGSVAIPAEAAKGVFYNRCAPELQAWAGERLCPQPIRAALSAVRATPAGLGSVRKHYIECTDDNALPIASQRAMQAHMSFDRIETLDSDHSPFLCMPNVLADTVARIAAD
jgi:pimeloyl-ACP methyl ester carboxylesterase